MARKQKMPNKATQKPVSDKNFVQDGFSNLAAKLGAGSGADNLLAKGGYDLDTRIITRNRGQLDGMYRGSWIVGKLVDAVAEDMTRSGIDINCDMAPDDLSSLNDEFHRLQTWGQLGNAIRWGRLYGGSIAVLIIDGQDPETPLSLKSVGPDSFKGLRVFDRWTCTPSQERIEVLGPNEGLPVSYMANEGAWNGKRIHHSRVIRFIGFPLPYYERLSELQWGASVVERLYDRLLAFDSTTHGAANLIFKAHLRTVQIEGLRDILSRGGPAEENLIKMFTYIRQLQSNEGLTILDAKDTFQTNSYAFSGLDKVLLSFGEQISGATGIPLVRLFGQSPSGLNSSGESDLRTYYDMIRSSQEEDLRPGIERIYDVMAMSKLTEPMPDGWSMSFRSLWQLSETEKATIANTDATMIDGLYNSGVLSLSQALKELRQQSQITGRFSNITDEDIEDAEKQASIPMSPFGTEEEAPAPPVNSGEEQEQNGIEEKE